jgi:hypothetical protein
MKYYLTILFGQSEIFLAETTIFSVAPSGRRSTVRFTEELAGTRVSNPTIVVPGFAAS